MEKSPETILPADAPIEPAKQTAEKGRGDTAGREHTTPDEQLRALGEALFPGMEAGHAEQAIQQAFETLHHTAGTLTENAITACEARWQAMQQEEVFEAGDAVPDEIFVGYMSLRNDGFSENEIRELMDASRAGIIETNILTHVQKEKSACDEWLSRSKERIDVMENGISTYFERVGVPCPTKERAPIVGFGKYQGMLIESAESGVFGAFEAGGRYMAEANAVYMKHRPEDETDRGMLDDARMHLLTHERLHSLSTTHVPKSVRKVMEGEHTPGFQVGFTKVLEGDTTLSYGQINEAVTEYFARNVSKELGYRAHPAGIYDEEVESLELLLTHLGDHENATAELLKHYTSINGFTDFKKAVEDRVGPYGFALYNALSTRPHMLEQFFQYCNNTDEGDGDEKMEMNIDVLQNARPPIEPSRVAEAYPFIKLMTHIRDPDTAEWKRVEFEIDEGATQTHEENRHSHESVFYPNIPRGWTELKHGTNLLKWGKVNPYNSDRIELTRPLSVISKEEWESDQAQGTQYNTTRTYAMVSGETRDTTNEHHAIENRPFEIRVLFFKDHVRRKDDREFATQLDADTKKVIAKYYFQNIQAGRHPLVPRGEILVKLGQTQESGMDIFYFVPESLLAAYKSARSSDEK